mgnify:CR=1 FL=1
MKDPNEKITLLFDTKQKKPGCMILQAIAGCDQFNQFLQMTFTDYETSITPDMKRITGTREQWEKLAALPFTEVRRSK